MYDYGHFWSFSFMGASYTRFGAALFRLGLRSTFAAMELTTAIPYCLRIWVLFDSSGSSMMGCTGMFLIEPIQAGMVQDLATTESYGGFTDLGCCRTGSKLRE